MGQVVLNKVRKLYGEDVAVHGVDLVIEDGELVVFLGPSGCGKSTTLRMIAGLEKISSGTLHMGSRDVTALEPKDRDIAMVFQNYALYPHKTIRENMAFGLRMRKLPSDQIASRVTSAAEMLGLAALLDRKPKQLSGGQMQRVALGRALVRDPEIFLLDEPLSNLDAKLRVKTREEIALLQRQVGKSMVYVTHDQVEAMTLADRIVIMRDGHVQQIGAPLEVYDKPANLFVAGFIGSPEMNLFAGRLDGRNFVAGDLKFDLSGHLADRATGDVTLGIRPEHIGIGSGQEGLIFNATVVEQLGSQTLCVGNIAGQPMRLMMERSDAVTPGSGIPVSLDPKRIHAFSTESGRRIDQ